MLGYVPRTWQWLCVVLWRFIPRLRGVCWVGERGVSAKRVLKLALYRGRRAAVNGNDDVWSRAAPLYQVTVSGSGSKFALQFDHGFWQRYKPLKRHSKCGCLMESCGQWEFRVSLVLDSIRVILQDRFRDIETDRIELEIFWSFETFC